MEPGLGHADLWFGQGVGHGFGATVDKQVALELLDHVIETRAGQIIGCISRNAAFRAHWRHHGHCVFDGIKTCRHSRADEDAIGNVKLVLVAVWQLFHQTDGVVTHITNQTGTHGRQVVGQFDVAFGDQFLEAIKRGVGFCHKGIRIGHRTTIEFGLIAKTPPDQIGFEAEEGIPSTNGSAFNRFKQIGVWHAFGDLEKSRDRRIKIGCQRGPENLRNAVIVVLLETGEIRFDFHGLSDGWAWPGWLCRLRDRKRATRFSRSPLFAYQFAAVGV